MRALEAVQKLEEIEVRSLDTVIAGSMFGGTHGIIEARDCLKVALAAGLFPASGRKAKGEQTDPEIIPQAFWQNGGVFTCNVDDEVESAVLAAEYWSGVTVEADWIIGYWQAPAHILEFGPRSLRSALDQLPPEDRPCWLLAHPDVTVTGLNERGERVPIDRSVFADGPFEIDHDNNAVSTGDWRLHWSAVMVELAASAPTPEPPPPRETKAPAAPITQNITDWARPIIDRIIKDGRQLRRAQFIEMVRAQTFDRRITGSMIETAWKNTTPADWRKQGQGIMPEDKRVADWGIYVV